MCFHQNRSLSTRAKGRGHTQQSQGRFHPECAISATAMRCVRPAGPRTISAHAGGTLFPGFQARVPFLPRLTSHGVMPTLQVEGLLREPGRHLSRFANLSFTFLGPLPSAGRPSQHSARSFIPLGLTGAGYARSCAQWRTLACHVARWDRNPHTPWLYGSNSGLSFMHSFARLLHSRVCNSLTV